MSRLSLVRMLIAGMFFALLSGCVNDLPDIDPNTTDPTETNATNQTGDTNNTIEQPLPYALRIIDPQDKTLIVQKADTEYALILNVSEEGKGVEGATVYVKTPPKQGSFFSDTIKTDRLGDAAFIYRSPQTLKNESFDVDFCVQENNATCDVLTITIATDTNQTDTNGSDIGNDAINYELRISFDNGSAFNLDEKKIMRVSLFNKDDNTPIDSAQIDTITITSKQPSILSLIDPLDANGAAQTSLTIVGKNEIAVYAKSSKEKSGLANVSVSVAFKNLKGYTQTITKEVAVTVFSGPPTAFQIVHGGTSYDPNTKHFKAKFVISGSDKYNNKINTSPTISVSVMAGYAKDQFGNRIIYGQNAAYIAGIYGVFDKGLPATLEVAGGIAPFFDFNTTSLYGIDLQRDFLAIFGNVRTYEVNGKWEIDEILSATKVSLSDQYEGESYQNIGFAIGHNYRHDRCSSDYKEYVVRVDSTDGTYQFNEEGFAFVTVTYPAEYMPGKKIAIIVNFIGKNPETGTLHRAGEVRFETLYVRSPWFLKGNSITVKAGTSVLYRHYGIVTTDNDDNFALVDSAFSCFVGDSTGVTVRIIGQNNPNQTDRNTLCSLHYVSYIDYNVTAGAEDGTFVVNNCKPLDEFAF